MKSILSLLVFSSLSAQASWLNDLKRLGPVLYCEVYLAQTRVVPPLLRQFEDERTSDLQRIFIIANLRPVARTTLLAGLIRPNGERKRARLAMEWIPRVIAYMAPPKLHYDADVLMETASYFTRLWTAFAADPYRSGVRTLPFMDETLLLESFMSVQDSISPLISERSAILYQNLVPYILEGLRDLLASGKPLSTEVLTQVFETLKFIALETAKPEVELLDLTIIVNDFIEQQLMSNARLSPEARELAGKTFHEIHAAIVQHPFFASFVE